MHQTSSGTAQIELEVYSLTDLGADDHPQQRIHDFGVGEHHTARFAVSWPAVVLSAVAARTSSSP